MLKGTLLEEADHFVDRRRSRLLGARHQYNNIYGALQKNNIAEVFQMLTGSSK